MLCVIYRMPWQRREKEVTLKKKLIEDFFMSYLNAKFHSFITTSFNFILF